LLALAHLSSVVFARQTPRGVIVLGAGTALGAGLDTDLGAALEGPSLFEAPMSTFLHVPPLPGSASVTKRFYRRPGQRWLRCLGMADNFDVAAMIARFQERAKAVRDRPLPPLEGTARREYMQRAQIDYQDFAMLGDADGALDEGILVLRIDLRPPEARGQA
jgi:hypothetical protein